MLGANPKALSQEGAWCVEERESPCSLQCMLGEGRGPEGVVTLSSEQ